jgi:hypothetical protein
MYGPNNQFLAARNAVLLAALLNRTLVLTDIFSHYLDVKSEKAVKLSYRFNQVLQVNADVKMIRLEDFANEHRDRVIHAPLVLHKAAYWKMLNERIVPEDFKQSLNFNFTRTHSFKPKQYSVDILKNMMDELELDNDKVVVLGLFNPIEFPARNSEENAEILNVFKKVRIHPKYKRIAQDWISANIPEEHKNCWACVHIRPYPDHKSCHEEWGSDSHINPKACARKMPTPAHFQDEIASTMEKCSSKGMPVVVANLPSMNEANLFSTIKNWNYLLFRKSDEFRSIEAQSGKKSLKVTDFSVNQNIENNFELSLVEQYTCALSPYFIGTPVSSWTDSVLLERDIIQDEM